MKYSQWIGIGAAILAVIACYMHWTWHPDLNKYFTGFFSENNMYGKPGKVFIFLAGVTTILYLIPRVWAKRLNMFLCCLTLAYAIKSFILYSGCYHGICPVRQTGIWIMLLSAFVMLLSSLLPDMPVKKQTRS